MSHRGGKTAREGGGDGDCMANLVVVVMQGAGTECRGRAQWW